MRKNRILPSIIALWLAIVGCNLPVGGPATESPLEKGTETPTPTFTGIAPQSETPTPTPTLTPVVTEACLPTVTTNTNANVRNGPGQVYNVIGNIPQGGTAKVLGKNSDGTWWYIEFAGGEGGHAWIAGSVTNAACIPDTLPIIAAPPTPTLAPTNTPAPTATPTPTSTGGIILLPPIFILPTPTPTFIIIFPIPIITVGP